MESLCLLTQCDSLNECIGPSDTMVAAWGCQSLLVVFKSRCRTQFHLHHFCLHAAIMLAKMTMDEISATVSHTQLNIFLQLATLPWESLTETLPLRETRDRWRNLTFHDFDQMLNNLLFKRFCQCCQICTRAYLYF